MSFSNWELYKLRPPELKAAMLEEMDLQKNLPLMTWQGQYETLKDAPPDVIIKYLPHVYWKAQAKLVEDHVPVGMMKDASRLMHPKAVGKLSL